jgi:hypothetical protein
VTAKNFTLFETFKYFEKSSACRECIPADDQACASYNAVLVHRGTPQDFQ